MSHSVLDHIEAIELYGPLLLAVVICVCQEIYPRLRVAAFFGVWWVAVTLPWVNLFCIEMGWWEFEKAVDFMGMPLSYYCGWVVWWGLVAVLLLGKLPSKNARWWVLLGMVLADLVMMPLLEPRLVLNAGWLLGELVLVLLCLVPALWLAHWTLSWSRLCMRAFLLSLAFGFGALSLPPFMAGHSVEQVGLYLQAVPGWQHGLFLSLLFLSCVPAVAAVVALAKLGKGTPVPLDPTQRLVVTGVYSYVRNPIQLGIVLAISVMALYLWLWVYVVMVVVSVAYCIGFARWSEHQEMKLKFGSEWAAYKQRVRCWIPRLLPADQPMAALYVALDCGPCSEVGRWFMARNPRNLSVVDASEWEKLETQRQPLKMLTYQHAEGEVSQGVAAISAALQHLHLGWAMLGWIIGFPGILWLAQISMDASGGSTRVLGKG